MISKRRDCRGRKCTTMLYGGVCHRTSTTHKSGNKMKRNLLVDIQLYEEEQEEEDMLLLVLQLYDLVLR